MQSVFVNRALGGLLFVGIILLFVGRLTRDGIPVYHQVAVAQASLQAAPNAPIVQKFSISHPPLTGVTLTFMHPPGMPMHDYQVTVRSPDGTLIGAGAIPASQVQTGTATWPVLQVQGTTRGKYSLTIAIAPTQAVGQNSPGAIQPIDIAYGATTALESGGLLVGGKPHPGALALTTQYRVGVLAFALHFPSLLMGPKHALPVGLPLTTGATVTPAVTVIAGLLTLVGFVALVILGALCAARMGDRADPSTRV
ncbi:MAG: hypothetical protein NVS4B2_18320 [Chloroflexota bacterium]